MNERFIEHRPRLSHQLAAAMVLVMAGNAAGGHVLVDNKYRQGSVMSVTDHLAGQELRSAVYSVENIYDLLGDQVPEGSGPAALPPSPLGPTLRPAAALSPAAGLSPNKASTSPIASAKPGSCLAQLPLKAKLGLKEEPSVYASELVSKSKLFRNHDVANEIVMNSTKHPYDGSVLRFKKRQVPDDQVGADFEGGTVQRVVFISKDGQREYIPSQDWQAHHMTKSAQAAMMLQQYTHYHNIGITTIFGPVLDVAPKGHLGVLGTRTFSSSWRLTWRRANADFVEARAAGETAVAKHFPGLGRSTANTDTAKSVTPPIKSLKNDDLKPYEKIKPADVMINSAVVPGLTHGKPALLSPATFRLFRKILPPAVVTYSDSLGGASVGEPLPKAAIDFWKAGGDVALYVDPQGRLDVARYRLNRIATLAQAALKNGSLSEKQLERSDSRILAARNIGECAYARELSAG